MQILLQKHRTETKLLVLQVRQNKIDEVNQHTITSATDPSSKRLRFTFFE